MSERESGEWRMDAACLDADPELFFPVESGSQQRRVHVRAAWTYCGDCPVRGECYRDAVRTGEQHGIRAGLDMQDPQVRDWIRGVRRKRRAS
ncbi:MULTISPECIES: WhiB family transcriptional regulator [Bacteria]|uniref:WhiB family transcriptional regulator n=1 Tax=Bacteria TaxID=2 RepID=UPI0036D9D933